VGGVLWSISEFLISFRKGVVLAEKQCRPFPLPEIEHKKGTSQRGAQESGGARWCRQPDLNRYGIATEGF
jgi:hypothetical protein